MFVSISGPPLSGKTTLYNDLRHALRDYDPQPIFIPDRVRASIELIGVGLAEADRPAFQHYVGFSQASAELEVSDENLVIFDKSLLDAVAYWDVLVGGQRPQWASILQSDRYDLVVVCDHRGIAEQGGDIDLMHVDLREQLADRISTLANKMSSCIMPVSGNRSERFSSVRSAIEERYKLL